MKVSLVDMSLYGGKIKFEFTVVKFKFIFPPGGLKSIRLTFIK